MKNNYLVKLSLLCVGFSFAVFPTYALKFEIPKELQGQANQEAAAKAEDTSSESVAVTKSNSEVNTTDAIAGDMAAKDDQLNSETGRIVGRVVDKDTGSPVRGVAVLLEGTDAGTVTGQNGEYRIESAATGIYTLSFIKSGYIESNVTGYEVVGGEEQEFAFALPPRPAEMSDDVYELQDFSVSAEEANNMMMKLELVMESDSMLSVMSSEDFSKFAASDISAAIKRVAGVSVVGGKYAVIRGLGDRYTQTTLNGMPVASPDPDRQAVQLDLFPTSLFDSLAVEKTYMVDRSANSTGSMDLKIKEFPEELTINVGAGVAYHSIATGNDNFLTNGSTTSDDLWANGAKNRKLSSVVREGGIPEVPDAGDVNDFLAGLGIGDAITQAEYDAQLQEVVDFSEANVDLNNHVKRKAVDPDYGYKVNVGDSFKLNDEVTVGLLGSVNYSNKNRMIEDAHYFRASNSANLADADRVLSAENFGDPGASVNYRDLTYDKSQKRRGFSWFVGTGINIGEDHSVRLQHLDLSKDEDMNALYVGQYVHGNSENPDGLEPITVQDMQYSERELISDQITGEHRLDLGFDLVESLQFNWGFGSDEATQDDNYYQSSLRGTELTGYSVFLNPEPSSSATPVIYKQWREVEDNRDYQKYDLKFEGGDRGGFESTLKMGYLLNDGDRSVFDEYISLKAIDTDIDELSDLDSLYAASYTEAADIDMESESEGYYIMGEQVLFERLRMIGGSRFQRDTSDVKVNGELKLRGAGTENPLAGLSTEGGYDQESWYPAATLIYDFTDSLQARAAYSKTIALPSPREVSPFATNTFGSSDIDVGNPLLQPSDIENFDIGLSYANEAGDSVGVMVFHKLVDGRIERLNGLHLDTDVADQLAVSSLGASLYSWYNNPNEATITGVEFEAEKSLAFLGLGGPFDYMSIGGNYTYIDAEVDRFPIEIERKEDVNVPVDKTRALTEQPEHIVNLNLTYDNPERGLRVSLIYYYIDDTLKSVSLDTGYDIYSDAYSTLDLTLSKRFAERYTLSFAAKNLTNPERRNYYDVEGSEVEADAARFGRLYEVKISAEF